MSLPVEFDIAIGITGQRVSFHYEALVPLSDEAAMQVVEETRCAFLAALRSPAVAGETASPTVVPGSVVSGEGGAGSSAPAPPEPVQVEVGEPRGKPSKPRKPKPLPPWPPEVETREERLARIAAQREERVNTRLKAS